MASGVHAGESRLPLAPGKLSAFTVIREVKILRGFGTWLARSGFDNPFAGLPIPKTPKYVVDILTDGEIAKLVAGIHPQTDIGARQYTLVRLMLDSGLRVGAVATARLEHLDLERRVLKVKGKGNKERIVPFGQRACAACTCTARRRSRRKTPSSSWPATACR